MPTPRKSASAAARRVFSDSKNQAYAADYLQELRETWREISTSVGRSALLAVVTAAVFELFTRAAIEKVSIGPFEIVDLSLIQKGVPVVLSYLYYDICSLTYRWYDYQAVHRAIMRTVHRDVATEGLDIFVQPHEHSITGPEIFAEEEQLSAKLGSVLPFLFFLGVALFQVYAYIQQFRIFGADDIALWLALALSALLFCYGTLIFIDYMRQP